ERVAEWLRYKKCMPLHAEIGLTNKCNQKCQFCTLDWITHGKDVLDFEVLERTLHQLEKCGIKSIYYAGEGEPTLHPYFADIIKVTKTYGMSVAVATNGARYNYEMATNTLRHISWIRFSLDTVDEPTYMMLHGVGEKHLAWNIGNIQNCVHIKKTNNLDVDIGVQALLMNETALYLKDFVIKMKEIGVDNVQIKPCHNHPKSSHDTHISKTIYERLKRDLLEMETDTFKVIFRTRSMERLFEARTYEECHGFNFYILINAKGDVVPCNIFYDKKEFTYGNIYDKSFEDIWTDKRRWEINKKIAESNFSMCGDYRCRLDVMNRHLQRVKYPEKNDEFI
ncbi:MAG: radical SAM protein, partial [Candidatus Scalindua sp.]